MLTDRDRRILEFEATRMTAGRKEDQIRVIFHVSPARYYQLLNRVIADPEALADEPMLVKRLLNQRAARVARRTEHRFTA
jgi:hypothetical protein